jgi:C1A family cysteine protease
LSILNNKLNFENIGTKGLGYLKGFNSHKDYSIDNPKVKDLVSKSITKNKNKVPNKLALKKDLRKDFSPVRDQKDIGSCTAFSVSGMVEYMQKKAFGTYTQTSPLFIYKTTRKLLGLEGDTGAYMRSVMGSIVLFGTPPEEYYPYDINKFDDNPDAFYYSFASSYQTIKYIRLDQPKTTPEELIRQIKLITLKGQPSIFGFTCFESLFQSDTNGGMIPFPSTKERIVGGHAVCIAGYDDDKVIKNQTSTVEPDTKGAFLIRNSWGTKWGEKGYGWIPYKYFTTQLADDVWTLTKQEWVDHIQFQE